jgi:pimeloyl-ACP methyl ester carboxylesterase
MRALSLKRILLGSTIAGAASYLFACGTLYIEQRELLYHPRPLLFEPDARDIAIPSDGVTLHGWVVNPGKADALIFFGGNGESVERDVGFFRDNLPQYSVYLVPYRGYSSNPGEPTQTNLFADSLRVFEWVHARHARVSLMGRSLGTGVATWLASQRRIERLVLVTPYDSIASIAAERFPLFPVAWFLKDPYESWRYAGAIRVPVLAVLAEDDAIIPRVHSDALIALFPTRPEVVVAPHANHNNIHNSATYAQALAAFMRLPATR